MLISYHVKVAKCGSMLLTGTATSHNLSGPIAISGYGNASKPSWTTQSIRDCHGDYTSAITCGCLWVLHVLYITDFVSLVHTPHSLFQFKLLELVHWFIHQIHFQFKLNIIYYYNLIAVSFAV